MKLIIRTVIAAAAAALWTLPAAAAPAADSSSAAGRRAAPRRTLQDIHIEGEIPVPQVLFVTARDQRRLVEFQHRRYLRSGRAVGEALGYPDRIVIRGFQPAWREAPPAP